MYIRLCLWQCVASLICGLACGQQREAVEVASIRPTTVRDGEISFDAANGRITVRNFSVWNLIRSAYHVRDLQISGGSAWVKEKGFDIQADAPQTGVPERREYRPHATNSVGRSFPTQAYPRDARSSGLCAASRTEGRQVNTGATGSGTTGKTRLGDVVAPGMPISSLCAILEYDLDRLVVDETGMKGVFAIRLQWKSDKFHKGWRRRPTFAVYGRIRATGTAVGEHESAH